DKAEPFAVAIRPLPLRGKRGPVKSQGCDLKESEQKRRKIGGGRRILPCRHKPHPGEKINFSGAVVDTVAVDADSVKRLRRPGIPSGEQQQQRERAALQDGSRHISPPRPQSL